MSIELFVGEVVATAEYSGLKFVETVHNVMDTETKTAHQKAEQGASYVREETARQIISLLQTAAQALSQSERMFANYLAGGDNDEAVGLAGIISKELNSLNAGYKDDATALASAIASGGAVGIAVALTITFAISGASAKETAPSIDSHALNEVQHTLEQLITARHSALARQYALTRMDQTSRAFIATHRQCSVSRPYRGEFKILLPALQHVHQPLLRLIQTQRRIALKDRTRATVDFLERLNGALTNTISAMQLAANRPRPVNLQKYKRI